MGIPLWYGPTAQRSSSSSSARATKLSSASAACPHARHRGRYHSSLSNSYNAPSADRVLPGATSRIQRLRQQHRPLDSLRGNGGDELSPGATARRPRSSQTLFDLLNTAPRRSVSGIDVYTRARAAAGVGGGSGGALDGLGDRERSLRYVLDTAASWLFPGMDKHDGDEEEQGDVVENGVAAGIAAGADATMDVDDTDIPSPDSHHWERVAHDLGLATAYDEAGVWGDNDDHEEEEEDEFPIQSRHRTPEAMSPSSENPHFLPAIYISAATTSVPTAATTSSRTPQLPSETITAPSPSFSAAPQRFDIPPSQFPDNPRYEEARSAYVRLRLGLPVTPDMLESWVRYHHLFPRTSEAPERDQESQRRQEENATNPTSSSSHDNVPEPVTIAETPSRHEQPDSVTILRERAIRRELENLQEHMARRRIQQRRLDAQNNNNNNNNHDNGNGDDTDEDVDHEDSEEHDYERYMSRQRRDGFSGNSSSSAPAATPFFFFHAPAHMWAHAFPGAGAESATDGDAAGRSSSNNSMHMDPRRVMAMAMDHDDNGHHNEDIHNDEDEDEDELDALLAREAARERERRMRMMRMRERV